MSCPARHPITGATCTVVGPHAYEDGLPVHEAPGGLHWTEPPHRHADDCATRVSWANICTCGVTSWRGELDPEPVWDRRTLMPLWARLLVLLLGCAEPSAKDTCAQSCAPYPVESIPSPICICRDFSFPRGPASDLECSAACGDVGMRGWLYASGCGCGDSP